MPSIQWGRDHEKDAFREYKSQVLQCHPNLKLRKAGIYIGNPPYLGASPDGILEDCLGNASGVIEIKCPYSAANLSVREAFAVLQDFYYFQIQGIMGITLSFVILLSGLPNQWNVFQSVLICSCGKHFFVNFKVFI